MWVDQWIVALDSQTQARSRSVEWKSRNLEDSVRQMEKMLQSCTKSQYADDVWCTITMYGIVNIKCNIHKHFTWKWLVIHSHFHKSSVKIWVECLEMKEAVKSLECRHHFLLRCELCRPECQCHHSSAISLFFPLFLGYFLVIPRVIFPLICVRSWAGGGWAGRSRVRDCV